MPRAPRCRLLLDPLLRLLRRNSSSQQGKQLRCTGSTVCTTAVTHSDPNTRSTHELSGRSVQGLCPSQLLAPTHPARRLGAPAPLGEGIIGRQPATACMWGGAACGAAAVAPQSYSLNAGCAGFYACARHGVARGGACV